jgi:hypothetical protein
MVLYGNWWCPWIHRVDRFKTNSDATETLDFAMPDAPAMEAFDEFKVVFLRDRKRMDKSARIAIDRFILVPR